MGNEINLELLREYSSSDIELNNFSNVIPSDWAFKALQKLAERNDCNFITNRSDIFSRRSSLTRHEAAIVIKECLKDSSTYLQEEKRLLNEFRTELEAIEALK